MADHTPGPWVFVEENYGLMPDHGYGLLHGEPGCGGWEKNLFVSVGCSGNAERALGEGVPTANARLIVAAPDLLEALKTLLAYDEQDAGCVPTDAHLDAQNEARAIIAKATGQ